MRRLALFCALAFALVEGVGVEQYRKSRKGQTRRPNLNRYYRHKLPDLVAHEYEFSLTLFRHKTFKSIGLDRVTESFEWNDSGGSLTGSLTLRRPTDSSKDLPIARGHVIRCRVRRRYAKKAWTEVWKMRVGWPETDPLTGQVTVPLSDDLVALNRGKRDWRFRKRKGKRVWRADQVTRKACAKVGVKVGRLAKGTADIGSLNMKQATALQVIQKAYAKEREESGRRFVIRMRDGKLEVLPYRRNPVLYVLSRAIESVLLSQTGKERPVTVIRAKGRVGKKQKKREFVAQRPEVTRRLGRVEKEISVGKVDSFAKLKSEARRALADELRVKRSATLEHAGIPFIRKGDGTKLLLPGDGYKGRSSWVFVTSASHRVDGLVYMMSLELNAEDTYADYEEKLKATIREKKREKREKAERGNNN